MAPDKVFALGIGRTFQLTRIFPRLTVMENMLVASQHSRSGARKRAMEQLEFVGIAGYHGTLSLTTGDPNGSVPATFTVPGGSSSYTISGLVLNTVGPFAKFGGEVVQACWASRCHYTDTTGEHSVIP